MRQINSRADLDAISGTAEFAERIRALAGSMSIRTNIAVYPEGYGEPGYEGPDVEPVWDDVEDLTTIERLGFTKAEILAEVAALED